MTISICYFCEIVCVDKLLHFIHEISLFGTHYRQKLAKIKKTVDHKDIHP